MRQGRKFELDELKETCAVGEHKDRVSEHEIHKSSIHDEEIPVFTREVGNHSKIRDIRITFLIFERALQMTTELVSKSYYHYYFEQSYR